MKITSIRLQLVFICSFLINLTGFGQFDFGDAPDPTYPTLQINNGANHMVSPLFLGSSVDVDLDGQPGIFSNGDDGSGIPDDEDGVVFSTWLVPGQNATVVVSASGNGFLDAWIDFQGNGNWSDPGDQIFVSQVISSGQNTLTFPVPISATAGIYTYGRFRLSSVGGLPTTGSSIDGEVEDYQIVIGVPNTIDPLMDLDPGLSFTQNEVSMSIDLNSGNLVAAYNDNPFSGGPGVGVSLSTDNGQSWIAGQLPIPINTISSIPMVDAFDPSVTHDDSGHVFVAHIATDYNLANGPVSGLHVHKSTDGGVTWGSPVQVDIEAGAVASPDTNYRFNDRCQIKVDLNPASPYYNYIYVVWLKDRGWNVVLPFSDIYISVSTDGGSTFSSAKQINHKSNNLGNLPIQAIASNGDLYVLWVDYNVQTGGNGVMLLDKSTDGGVTWGTDIVIDTILLPPLNLNTGVDVRAKGAAILRTSPTDSNELYIAYASNPPGADEADVFFIKSNDGGSNWTDSLRVNDDATTTDQVLPWMEVAPNGVIDMVWYDRRNDVSDLKWDVYATTSTDTGTTFSTNIKVNGGLSFATPQTPAGPWFGEYLGLAVSDSAAFVGFTSSLVDLQGDVFFASFQNPVLTSDSCNLICVTDSTWRKSTVVTTTNLSGLWNGVNGALPVGATFSSSVSIGQPFPWNHIGKIEGADPISTGHSITYFRKAFQLSTTTNIEARFRLNVDDQAEIYLNGYLIARTESFGLQNFKNPSFDARFFGDANVDNGFGVGDSFTVVSSASIDTIFKAGLNEIVVVVRNLGKPSDAGGFSFRMDIGGCGGIKSKSEERAPGSGKKLEFMVYPNPVSGVLNVSIPNFKPDQSLQIFDLMGNLIGNWEVSSAEMKVDLHQEPTGIYVLKLISDDGYAVRKILKN